MSVCICEYENNQETLNALGIVTSLIMMGMSAGNLFEHSKLSATSKQGFLVNFVLFITLIMFLSGLISLVLSTISIQSVESGYKTLKKKYCNKEIIKRPDNEKCLSKDIQKATNYSNEISAYILLISLVVYSIHGLVSGLKPFSTNKKQYMMTLSIILVCIYNITQINGII